MRLLFLLKASWLCMAKGTHNGQWPERPCVIAKHQPGYKSQGRRQAQCGKPCPPPGLWRWVFQHERVQSWRSSTDNHLQPAELLHAGELTYICGSHKGENGALCSMSVG